MAEQNSIASNSEAERYVIFECVVNYISDIRTLVFLSLVNKRISSSIYRSNGLRQLTYYKIGCTCKLNGVNIRVGNREEKLKDGLRWIWTVGKRLKTVDVCAIGSNVLPLVNSLAATDKRRIETIQIRRLPCEMASDLVRENRDTLRSLCIEWKKKPRVVATDFYSKTSYSLTELSDRESFWSVVQQCQVLESLNLKLCYREFPIFPVEFVHVLCHAPLKHLGLGFEYRFYSKSEALQELVDVLSVENLRDNLESLELDYHISMPLLCPLVKELSCSHSPVVFLNVTKLSCNIVYAFLQYCFQPDPINWLAFWTVFPAVKEIKNILLDCTVFFDDEDSSFVENVFSFCKTYLEVSVNRTCDIKMEIPLAHDNRDTEELRAAISEAITLCCNRSWCVSHGVQIQTDMRGDKVQKVTQRKDNATLVFDIRYLQD